MNKTLTEQKTPNAKLDYVFLIKYDISDRNISRDVFNYHYH